MHLLSLTLGDSQPADLTFIQAPVLGPSPYPSAHYCWPLEICEPIGIKLLPFSLAGKTFPCERVKPFPGACEG